MELNDDCVRSFALGRVFKDKPDRINSIDFHRVHDLAVTAGDDDAIHLYDTLAGSRKKTCFSKKYGVSNAVFTHHTNAILYASTRGNDHSLRYLSLHDNKYLRYFPGHRSRVTSLSMSPKDDTFISTAFDKTVRLWDLRSANCVGLLELECQATAAFDQQGLVFAVGAEAGIIKLYGTTNYEKGPFVSFVIEEEKQSPASFSCLRFSPDGKHILAVVEGRIYVIDAFGGAVKAAARSGNEAEGGVAFEASFSPDGRYFSSGCDDHSVKTWRVEGGELVGQLSSHAGLPLCCKWAPRRALLATACSALAMWIPDLSRVPPPTQRPAPQQGTAPAPMVLG